MISSTRAGLAATVLLYAVNVQAETTPSPITGVPAPATAVILAAPAENVVRTGTQIELRTAEPLTTQGKKLKVGQRVQLEVVEPVTLNGQIVIPAGSPAMAEITDVRNKAMWGKSGRINARVLYVRANGRQIRVTGQFDDKGTTGTAGVIAAVAFIPIAGFTLQARVPRLRLVRRLSGS
jgi:hypothetical protein